MKNAEIASLLIFAALFAVWPVPHTIAIRNLLLVAGILVVGFIYLRSRPSAVLPDWRGPRIPLVVFLVLTGWMTMVAVFVSNESAWALNELRGQWLPAVVSLFAGVLLAAVLQPGSQYGAWFCTGIAAILAMQILFWDTSAVINALKTGNIPFRMESHLGVVDKANYVNHLLLIIVATELFLRGAIRNRWLPVPTYILVLVLGLGLFAEYVQAMRNGIIELVAIALMFAALFVYEYKQRLSRKLLLMGACVIVIAPLLLGYLNYRIDARWHSLVDTIPIALDTKNNKSWMDISKYPLPRLPDGQQVSESNYLRIAWAKVGIELFIENPLGVGYGRNAFGHARMMKYGHRGGHSHSGIIDFAIGVGIPGVLLWLAFLASLIVVGWIRYAKDRHFIALLLILVTTSFATRMLVDSIIRDHMIQMFLFLVGILVVMVIRLPETVRRF